MEFVEPRELGLLVEMREDGDRIDDVETGSREIHWRGRVDCLVGTGEVSGRPGDGVAVDIHAAEIANPGEFLDMARDPSGAAAEVEPAVEPAAGSRAGIEGGGDLVASGAADGRELLPATDAADLPSQTRRREPELGVPVTQKVADVAQEIPYSDRCLPKEEPQAPPHRRWQQALEPVPWDLERHGYQREPEDVAFAPAHEESTGMRTYFRAFPTASARNASRLWRPRYPSMRAISRPEASATTSVGKAVTR